MNEITLAILAKNEEASISKTIESVIDHIDKVLVVDDCSEDNTTEVAKSLGAKVLSLPFAVEDEGFAVAANWMISQVDTDWVLIIDGDEFVSDPEFIRELTTDEFNAWSLPRRKWLDYDKSMRIEYEAYPDWQTKLFRVKPENRFEGEMHVRFIGKPVVKVYSQAPHIEHLQYEFRTEEKKSHREKLYNKLANIQGVEVKGGANRKLSTD